jgi:hypothetical protein
MIGTMKATVGGTFAAHRAQQQSMSIMRKAVGFAIVTSGFAVIVAQALQHAFGG